MAVSTDFVSNPGATFTGNTSWSHAGAAPKGVFVSVVNYAQSGVSEVTGVTYGGVALAEVASLFKATGEPGGLKIFFKGSGLPAGTQTVAVTTSGSTVTKAGGCRTLSAAGNVEIVHQVTWNSDSLTNPTGTLLLAGRTSYCFEVVSSGQNAPAGVSPLANWSGAATDFGNSIFMEYVYSLLGTGNVTAGWTQAAEDAIGVAFAVAEVSVVVPVAPPNPTPTVFVPYHAFDNLVMRGTRAAQPSAVLTTPGALYNVTDEAKVERANGTIWESYSASATLPTTIAYKDQANIFTQNQTISVASNPILALINTSRPVDARRWGLLVFDGDGSLYVQTHTDAAAFQSNAMSLTRAGAMTVGGSITSSGPITSPSRTVIQYAAGVNYGLEIQHPNHVGIIMNETGAGANLKKWRIHTYTGNFYLQPMTDDESALAGGVSPFIIYRNGNVLLKGPEHRFESGVGMTYCRLHLRNASEAAGNQTFVLLSHLGSLYLAPTSDDGTYWNAGASWECGVWIQRDGATGSGGVFYPGQYGGGGYQKTWYLGSHASYGLWTNTGLYVSAHIWSGMNAYIAGVMTATGGLGTTPLNGSQITSGTVATAYLGAAPAGVTGMSITGANSHFYLNNSGNAAHCKIWRFINWDGSDGTLRLEAIYDDYNLQSIPIAFERGGGVTIQGRIAFTNVSGVAMNSDSPSSMAINVLSGHTMYIRGPGAGAQVTSFFMTPPNGNHCGHPEYPWYQVFAFYGMVTGSDAALKTDIRDSDLGLAFVEKLRARRYRFKHDPFYAIPREQIGFTTEEVEAAMEGRPFAVLDKPSERGESGPNGLNYAGFVPILTTAVQELAARLRLLEERWKN